MGDAVERRIKAQRRRCLQYSSPCWLTPWRGHPLLIDSKTPQNRTTDRADSPFFAPDFEGYGSFCGGFSEPMRRNYADISSTGLNTWRVWAA